MITSSASFQSEAPAFFEEVDRTNSYILWKRIDDAYNRPILNEATLPGRLVDCSKGGGQYFSTEVDGTATLMPRTVLALRDQWTPSRSAPGRFSQSDPGPHPGILVDLDAVLHPDGFQADHRPGLRTVLQASA